MKVDEWTEEAFEASVEEFSALIEEAKGVLEAEKESRAQSGLIRISPRTVKNVVVVGDLHGDMESFVHILKDIEDLNADRIVFLGDYGNRGSESIEVYYVLLKLKISEGKEQAKEREKAKKIIMLRGNHEGPPDMPVMPHDLPFLFTAKYGVRGKGGFYSMRGAGRMFGEDVTERGLRALGVKTLMSYLSPRRARN